MAITRAQLVSDTVEYMDGADTNRWSSGLILRTLDSVYDGEWSNILSAAPYYRAATRTVTTDANGLFDVSDLNSGTGDNAQLLYRIISMTDGDNIEYAETRLQDVPTALTGSYSPFLYNRLYYFMGSQIQVLPPVQATLNVTVNYKPPSLSDLASDSSVIDFPPNSHLVLAWEAGGRLLNKGGAETNGAAPLFEMAKQERETMILDLQRRSINPMRVMPLDSASDWASA